MRIPSQCQFIALWALFEFQILRINTLKKEKMDLVKDL